MGEERKDALHEEGGTEEKRSAPEEVAREEGQAAEPVEKIQELKVQLDDYKDRYLRTYAEMDNMRKRFARERQDVVKYGTERLLKEFLLVYDAIEKSIDAAMKLHPEDEPFIEGLRMTEKLFLETLKKNQVEPIKTQNVAFDPNYHEAMMQVNRDDIPKGMVVDEIERGFMIHDRLLRPAKVTVSG